MPEYFSIDLAQMQVISQRIAELTRWLGESASDCTTTQKHLEEGSIERAYWHYGYLCALRDVVAAIEKRSV
jgi:hypothetical protein